MPRIDVLTFTQFTPGLQESLRQGLRDHGYVEGQNIVVEWRAAEGQPDRAKALAMGLVRLNVDIIVANLTPAVQATKNATSTIPIVMAAAGDPVGTGLIASLAAGRQHHRRDENLRGAGRKATRTASGPDPRASRASDR